MENPFNRANSSIDESRRRMLTVAIPGGWLPQLLRDRSLSPTGQASLVVDVALLTPALFAACSRERSNTAGKYDGPINRWKGLEYVSEASFDRMTQALEKPKHPMLDKISKGVRALKAAKRRPSEFPSWVDDKSFPFTFVQDSASPTSTAVFQISELSKDVSYIAPATGVTQPQEGIDKFITGIKLGLKHIPFTGDPLLPAMLLAKEYLTLLHSVALNEEFYDIARNLYPQVIFVDPSGRAITDRSKQQAVGRRLLYNNLQNDTSDTWRLLDGFSILMLGPVLRDLVADRKIENYGSLGVFALAANLFTNSSSQLQSELVDFMNTWQRKEGFAFPSGAAAKIGNEPFFSTTMNLQNQIIQAGLG